MTLGIINLILVEFARVFRIFKVLLKLKFRFRYLVGVHNFKNNSFEVCILNPSNIAIIANQVFYQVNWSDLGSLFIFKVLHLKMNFLYFEPNFHLLFDQIYSIHKICLEKTILFIHHIMTILYFQYCHSCNWFDYHHLICFLLYSFLNFRNSILIILLNFFN